MDNLSETRCDETAGKETRTMTGLDELIQMPLHRLEHEVEFLALWKKKRVVQEYDVWMRGYCK